MAETFGQRMKRDRHALVCTHHELAAAAGVGGPHISKVENDRERPSDDLVARLAAALGQDPDEYMLAARRLPLWAAEMLAEQPAAWLMLLRQRAAITPESLGEEMATLCEENAGLRRENDLLKVAYRLAEKRASGRCPACGTTCVVGDGCPCEPDE